MRIVSSRSSPRGFTIIEIVVVLAIIAALAAMAFSVARAAARNVYLHQAANELTMRAVGLRSTALSEGQDYLLVVVDAPNNDASQCGWWSSSACTRYFILFAPQVGWSLSAFDPSNPAANASISEVDYLPRGARLYVAGSYSSPPIPFDNVAIYDGNFYGTCANGSRCFAIRFCMNGTVRAERPAPPAGPTIVPAGFAFVLASDAELEGAGGDHRGVVVGFPSGVVKTWSYAP